ncbi:hypothetical protein EBME_1551 [bacterium endosymbiont of Mortierella elongata FMR23-6]|nr:hypothetical protein EBME_1551 [bacterium endosymbiont of Mortierella elongata FMR23-6]
MRMKRNDAPQMAAKIINSMKFIMVLDVRSGFILRDFNERD